MHTKIKRKLKTPKELKAIHEAVLAYRGKLAHIATTSDDVARRRAEEAEREDMENHRRR